MVLVYGCAGATATDPWPPLFCWGADEPGPATGWFCEFPTGNGASWLLPGVTAAWLLLLMAAGVCMVKACTCPSTIAADPAGPMDIVWPRTCVAGAPACTVAPPDGPASIIEFELMTAPDKVSPLATGMTNWGGGEAAGTGFAGLGPWFCATCPANEPPLFAAPSEGGLEPWF